MVTKCVNLLLGLALIQGASIHSNIRDPSDGHYDDTDTPESSNAQQSQ
jgi:hypothetical protein